MKPLLIAFGRMAAGLGFLVSGISKVIVPAAFLSVVHDYPAAAHLPASVIAAWLPWIEIFLGACLLVGLAGRGAALWSGLLLILYTFALVQRAIVTPHDGAWVFETLDCGCGFGTVQVGLKLLENALLIAFCCSAVVVTEERFALTRLD